MADDYVSCFPQRHSKLFFKSCKWANWQTGSQGSGLYSQMPEPMGASIRDYNRHANPNMPTNNV